MNNSSFVKILQALFEIMKKTLFLQTNYYFMKKTLLFVFSFLLTLGAIAQNKGTLIEEHFDTEDFPSGWTVMGQGLSNWYVNNTEYAGGEANEMFFCWDPAFDGTSRLVTPPVNLTNIDNVIFSMKHCIRNYYGTHILSIETSSNDGVTWNMGWSGTFYDLFETFDMQETIVTSDMGLPSVRFAISYSGDSHYLIGWHFDDIEIFTMAENDVTLKSIDVNPRATAGYNDIDFTLVNRSTSDVTEFVASYYVDDEAWVQQTFSTVINPNEEKKFVFDTPALFYEGLREVTVVIEKVNGGDDSHPEDNTIVKEIDATLGSVQRIPLIEHFSSSSCTPCVAVNTEMQALCANNPGKYTYTKYQMQWPSPGDPYYTLEGGFRRDYYSVGVVPFCLIESERFSGAAVTQEAFDNHYNTPANADIRGSFTVDGNVINAKVDFMSYSNYPIVNAFVSVNEKVTYNNATINGETSFHHVFMKFLSEASGDLITLPAGQYQHLEYSYDMSATCVEEMSDLEVVAWLQNYDTQEVWNSAFLYEYTDIHPYPVKALNLVKNGNQYTATWEAPDGGNALSYNIYVNNTLVDNTTELQYSFDNGLDYNIVAVEAVYTNNMTSVKMAKASEVYDQVVENESNDVCIYPNPSNGKFNIKGENIAYVEVYNISGSKMMAKTVNNGNAVIELANEASGIYFVTITDADGNTSTHKIVKR